MKKLEKTALVIPVYNEERVIKDVVNKLTPICDSVVCVNDGSKDKSLSEIKKTDAKVLSHLTNIGQGGALETGIKYALKNPQIKYFVTFDADGQHRIEDVEKMLEEMETGKYDIMLGSRFLKENEVPTLKKMILKMATLFTNVSTGLKLTDTHNGLRVFNRKFAEKVNLKNFGMAHASEFLDIIKAGKFKYKEIPVTIDYTEYSKSKGQPIINSVNILFDIFFNKKG